MRARPTVRFGFAALATVAGLGLLLGVALSAADSPKSAQEAAMRAVLAEAGCGVFVKNVFVAGDADTFVYYKGYRNPDTTGLVGYAVKARGRGYSGSIETVAGVGLDGRLRGIRVTSHKETSGLGSKIAEVRPAKTFLDALKAASGKTQSGKVIIELGPSPDAKTCLEVQIRDTTLCSVLDKAVADRDTAVIADVAPKALDLGAQHNALLGDRRAVVEAAEKFVKRVRSDQTPWWQAQFAGKTAEELVLSKDKTAKSIQGITGATVSTRAVTDPVKNAIVRLGQAMGGFQEAEK